MKIGENIDFATLQHRRERKKVFIEFVWTTRQRGISLLSVPKIFAITVVGHLHGHCYNLLLTSYGVT